ncbi:MAG TPA: RDD family protein [Mycobacteriales bacterium]|nr:RDD family protein [Mycobacteriales bacterium]
MDPHDPNAGSFPPPPGYAGPAYDAPPPSGMPLLAEWPVRVVAWLIDAVISGVPQAILYAFNKNLAQLFGLAIFIYFQYRQGTTGQTPGKQVMKIRLLKEQDGQVVGFGNAIVRGILHIVDALPCLLGFLWPLWDEKKQTFADKIMKTVVVKQ